MTYSTLPALREKSATSGWKKNDVLVLFGELFQRGYANGLVEEAQKKGMKIVYATVGRRDKDLALRPLTNEELENSPQPLINIPLEAGFDLEPSNSGTTPVDQMKDLKLSDWQTARLDFQKIEESRQNAIARFKNNTTLFLKELENHIPEGSNVLFAHLMAGGVPRTKIIMPLVNRVVKGTGERYLPSKKMWESDLGKVCSMNFFEVTAETFRHLIDLSADFRQKRAQQGSQTSYLAYGYHGTEILIDQKYQWQTYTPYIQGWAKMRLESVAIEAQKSGIKAAVYNCPEILTNSSSIFQGVEVSLYPLLEALRKESPQSLLTQKVVQACASMLKDGFQSFDQIRQIVSTYFNNPEILDQCQFDLWPQHTTATQLETMLKASDDLIELHKNPKQLITFVLSEVVFSCCGQIMLQDAWKPENAVSWIGHDIIAKSV